MTRDVALVDALVVGAGPTGCMVARELARMGWRVLLVEREGLGRDRVCGGFLGPEVVKTFSDVGLEDASARLTPVWVRRVIFSGPGTDVIEAPLPHAGGWSVRRAVFDHWLADHAARAGVTVVPQTHVVAARRANGLWHVLLHGERGRERVGARVMIRAFGRRHLTAAPADRRRVFFGCKTVYAGGQGLAQRVALHFVRAGHVGFDPLPDGHMTMCLYVERARLEAARGDLDQMMARLSDENPRIGDTLAGARRVTPWLGCQAQPDGRTTFSADGVFCVGDAVTMVNPILGGGISVAIGSALLLARALDAGRRYSHTEAQVAAAYAQAWRRQFQGKARLGHWLGRCERSAPLTKAILHAVTAQPALLKRLVQFSRPSPVPVPLPV